MIRSLLWRLGMRQENPLLILVLKCWPKPVHQGKGVWCNYCKGRDRVIILMIRCCSWKIKETEKFSEPISKDASCHIQDKKVAVFLSNPGKGKAESRATGYSNRETNPKVKLSNIRICEGNCRYLPRDRKENLNKWRWCPIPWWETQYSEGAGKTLFLLT